MAQVYLPVVLGTAAARGAGRVFVAGHVTQTLDGRIACENGQSKWIGNEADLRHAHRMRALLDGVMVGAGTALCDDPQLTVRHVEGPNPRRIVLSGRGRVLRRGAGLRVFTPPGCEVVVDDTFDSAVHDPMARLIKVPSSSGSIEPNTILELLRDRGIHSLYLEGGATAVSSFLQARCIDLLQVHIAAMVMGSGLPSFVLPAVDHVQDSIKFTMTHAMLDGHVLLSCWPARSAQARTALV
jgi:5-amino-6-(5-phosphoribosylamino)uracil reductase/diaminohydroxyphosphoribosylaminopyrimidine deaminase/5-amino-6-(5-phosphoribosylamino)uracil reductase